MAQLSPSLYGNIDIQAGAELGQAQLKLGLDFNQTQYTFGLSKFDLVELVGYILGLTEKIWLVHFGLEYFVVIS